MNHRHSFISGLTLVLLGAIAGAAAVAQESPRTPNPADARRMLTIPAMDLGRALREFGRQTGLHIVMDGALGQGVKSRPVDGAFSIDGGLKQLLADTGLYYEYLDERTIAIRAAKEGTSSSGLSPADQMRMAQLEYGNEVGSQAKAEDQDDERQVTVRDTKIAPDFAGNADIPRTINDVQPYYVFDARTIMQSGASTVDEFLKQRLTMNTVAQTYQEMSGLNTTGAVTTVNLRGLGTNKTLILVNGRRLPGVTSSASDGFEGQPDINGIALSSIERIEVLPSSASGIYGGGAMGGVINVILKRDYSGGEARVTYDTMADVNAPRRNASFSYGMALEGGRTHINVSGGWSDAKPYLLKDRQEIFKANLDRLMENSPAFISTTTWFGTTTNILALGGNLVLKNDGNPLDLGASVTYVPPGTSPDTSPEELAAGLAANAGKRNLEFPMSTQAPSGLLRPFGVAPTTRSLMFDVRRQMQSWIELGLSLRYADNRSESLYNAASLPLAVNANTPHSPFMGLVLVMLPDASDMPVNTRSETMSASLEARMNLPRSWMGLASYTRSRNTSNNRYYAQDANLNGITDGTINPFVDTLLYPQDFRKYIAPIAYKGKNDLDDLEVRVSGPLPALPWGAPRLTAAAQYRVSHTPERNVLQDFPFSTNSTNMVRYYERESRIGALYAELSIPLVKPGVRAGLYNLELQAAGRSERFEVDTGTVSETTHFKRNPVTVTYNGPTRDGLPFQDRASYTSTSSTIGFKYQPIESLTLRVSRATAFVPPTPGQLTVNPVQSANTVTVNDPTLDPPATPVYTLNGANGNLAPENSKSINGGIIFEPRDFLKGLRLNAEYYRTEQFDAIVSLNAQTVVDLESVFPERVQRDETGRITLVDISLVNLFHRETEGMDFSADYTWETRRGYFGVRAVHTTILHLKNQYSATQPELDTVNRPAEGGAAKYKSNLVLTWEGRHWNLGWTARYTGAYEQYQRSSTNVPNNNYVAAQGGTKIPSQLYHDLLVGYRTGEAAGTSGMLGGVLSNLNVQLGIRNLFNTLPPIDAYYVTNYYLSPFGDARLRSLWLSVRKQW